jgi:predicted ABC-type ATPase
VGEPTLYIIAGPNGVGKTTFADRFLPEEARQLEFVNPDLIARGLSPYAPEAVSVEAGKIALRRIRDLIAQRNSFTWETTMSGRSAVNWLKEARSQGFEINLYFLWVHSVRTTIRRIQQRVTEGGHNIPEGISERRFLKTIQNFFEVYRPLCTKWKFFQNESSGARLLAVEKNGRLAFRDRTAFERVCKEAEVQL